MRAPELTAEEMRQAAHILVKASVVYEAFDPANYPWTAARLRHEAEHLEAE